MLNDLFNADLQKKMEEFFLYDLSKKGEIKHYKKKHTFDPVHSDAIYIVVDGQCQQVLYSENGAKTILYYLSPGTIFGEMNFFELNRTFVLTEFKKDSAVSIVKRAVLQEELQKDPDIYRFFIHSMIRKYRLLIATLADLQFNDSLGQMAGLLLRFSFLKSQPDEEGLKIKYQFTHQDLANRLGCSRITATKIINLFKKQDIIACRNKYIIVKDQAGLKSYTNLALD